jgi:nucleoside-diphosphate-sugar epimerase
MITGASGLVGLHLYATIKKLILQKNYNIQVYGTYSSEPTEYFKELCNFKGSEIINGDISDFHFLDSLPMVDFIIHAAGYGQPNKFMDNQTKTLKLNTVSIFELMKKLNKNGKFLFISSSEVYSGSNNTPFNEKEIGTTNTDHPRSCYIEGKRCGEAIVNSFRATGINAKSARLSLAYGPGTKIGDKRVLNSFIDKALAGNIEMVDEGKSLRVYCYISDVVYMMWKILFEGSFAVYNIGGVSKTSIKELADTISKELAVDVIIPNVTKSLLGSPDNVSLDMSRFEGEFGKIEYIPLDKGIKKTINWQMNLNKL